MKGAEEIVPPPPWDPHAVPGSDGLPLQYSGPELPDGEAPDGRLRYSPGVQNIQISRANRAHPPALLPESENEKGWTYQHHVGIGYWRGLLYGVWDMTHTGEDNPTGHLVYATSSDGFRWSEPKDLYPFKTAFNLRFYFFHSTNDRMLAFAAGYYPTGNISESRKRTLLVREIRSDHRLGKIYTLINKRPGDPPFYLKSWDMGFLQACEEALRNRPLLEQADYGLLLGDRKMKWHEGKNWPGGEIPRFSELWRFGKAFSFYHRADGAIVGICKMGFVTQSRDEGENWSLPVIPKGIIGGGGKLWAQKTPDGRYAMVYIPQRLHRYPMAVTCSDDGITFRNMRVIHGEVAPQRYEGRAKDIGPQYLRGITEWGSDARGPDANSIWTIYSVNKEDIWVSRIPSPILADAKAQVDDTFEAIPPGPRVPEWNTYAPLWAPVRVAEEPESGNHFLELEDREPTDYARAIRTFPESGAVDLSFRLAAAQNDRGRLEIELLGESGSRPVRMILDEKGMLQAVDGRRAASEILSPGLRGTIFSKEDFQKPKEPGNVIGNFDNYWGESEGRDWSARWTGSIEGPYRGVVAFHADATDGLRLAIADKVVIDGLAPDGPRLGKINMEKGRRYPVSLAFTSAHGRAELRLFWSWADREQIPVPITAFSHGGEPQIKPTDWMPYRADDWLHFEIHVDCERGFFSVTLDGRKGLERIAMAEPSAIVYALSFRTGEYRGRPPGKAYQNLPDTEEPLPPITYRIDDVRTVPRGAKKLFSTN